MVSVQPSEQPDKPNRRNFLQFSLASLFGLTTATAIAVKGCLLYKREQDLWLEKRQWEEIKTLKEKFEMYPHSFFQAVKSRVEDIDNDLRKKKYSWDDIASRQERIETLQPIANEFAEWIVNQPKWTYFDLDFKSTDRELKPTPERYAEILEMRSNLPKGSLLQK